MTEQLLIFIRSLKSDESITSFDEAATKQAVILQLLIDVFQQEAEDIIQAEEKTPLIGRNAGPFLSMIYAQYWHFFTVPGTGAEE